MTLQLISQAALLADLRQRLNAEEPLVIAGLGDSLTYGWMVSRGFFDRFIDMLKSEFPSCPITAINAGIPGDTALGGLSRLRELLDKKPAVVTVQFGLNDMYQGISKASFQATLDKIVKRLLSFSVIPILVTSCPLNWDEGQRLAETFYDAIRDTAKANDIPCVSLDRRWLESAGPPNKWSELVQCDNVHPTDAGHQLMADGLLRFMFAPL